MSEINDFGLKRTLITGCGKIHFQAFFDRETGELRDVFCNKGLSPSGCPSHSDISRLISLAARNYIPSKDIIDQLTSVEPCPIYRTRSISLKDTSTGTSCASAIGHALSELCNIAKEKHTDYTPVTNKTPEYTLEIPIIVDSHTTTTFEEIDNKNKEVSATYLEPDTGNPCPECGAHLSYSGGCMTCNLCGWSRCD